MDKEKQKALEGALKSIEKQFGKGAVMRHKPCWLMRKRTKRLARPLF